jgi:pimeloyl-ACP methyl ester carboxylesterase
VILGRHWGFDVKDVTVPAVLWQGEHDTLVPPPMGRYLAARLPHCDARFIPNAGHLLMIDRMPEVVSALLTP